MLDPKNLDELARRLAASLPKGVQVLQEDINRSFRATLEAGLGRLELVTREEFDVQAAVLARTRAKLEALARRVAELEAGYSGSAATSPGTAAGVDSETSAPEAPSA
ncbi:MAG: accessory factor UbiK family protein [Chromatiaceae bacterium]|nr:MAG: accessory factor UbiK family protein [Chromatiaceae bacterium]